VNELVVQKQTGELSRIAVEWIRPTRSIVAGESLPLELQRIGVNLLGRAISDLRPTAQPFDKGIHSARKKMKRLRGMLRLVRDEVGYRTYREENVVLRDTARSLSAIRDARVVVETLRRLRDDYADLIQPETFATPEAWLLERHRHRRQAITQSVVTNAICNLGTARRRFAASAIEETVRDDYAAIAGGIERVYRRGYRGLRRAADTKSVEDLHEWRKRVKYLRYQMETLKPLHPKLIGATAESLDELGEQLGDDHDLAILAEIVIAHPESCRDERERWMLIALIHERRAGLQAQALRHGTALYNEKPQAFVERIGAYWGAAHS
jgi:CHAD domain-containing protein